MNKQSEKKKDRTVPSPVLQAFSVQPKTGMAQSLVATRALCGNRMPLKWHGARADVNGQR